MSYIIQQNEVVKEVIDPLILHTLSSLFLSLQSLSESPWGLSVTQRLLWLECRTLLIEQTRGYFRPFQSGPYRSFSLSLRRKPARILSIGCSRKSPALQFLKQFSEVPWGDTGNSQGSCGINFFLRKTEIVNICQLLCELLVQGSSQFQYQITALLFNDVISLQSWAPGVHCP